MATLWLTNAFSLNMLSLESVAFHLVLDRIDTKEARHLLESAGNWRSAVGHADTAKILSGMLDMPVEHARVTLTLKSGDQLVVAQYVGPRLPEGATVLPEGARIDWFYLTI